MGSVRDNGRMTSDVDSLLAGAIELARAAALETADADVVGSHVDLAVDGEFMVTILKTLRWLIVVGVGP